jgi:hypothetical protein
MECGSRASNDLSNRGHLSHESQVGAKVILQPYVPDRSHAIEPIKRTVVACLPKTLDNPATRVRIGERERRGVHYAAGVLVIFDRRRGKNRIGMKHQLSHALAYVVGLQPVVVGEPHKKLVCGVRKGGAKVAGRSDVRLMTNDDDPGIGSGDRLTILSRPVGRRIIINDYF